MFLGCLKCAWRAIHSSSTVGWRIIGRARATNSGDGDSVVNGLQTRIPVDQAAIEQSKILKFRFELRNLGAKDLHLNVGTRSREGGRQYLIRGCAVSLTPGSQFGNQLCYFLKTRGGPLTRLALRSTLTSTRSAILMNGIPLFIPYSLRSKAMVPTIAPEPVPSPETVSVSFSALVTPRIVKLPSTSKVLGLVGTTFVDLKVM